MGKIFLHFAVVLLLLVPHIADAQSANEQKIQRAEDKIVRAQEKVARF